MPKTCQVVLILEHSGMKCLHLSARLVMDAACRYVKYVQRQNKCAQHFNVLVICKGVGGCHVYILYLPRAVRTYQSEGSPAQDIWSLHTVPQGSYQMGRVVGTSSPSVGFTGGYHPRTPHPA